MSVYASDFPPVGEVFPFSVMGDVHGGMSHLHHAVSRTLRAGLKTLVQVGDFWIYDDPGELQKLDRMIGTAAAQSGLSPEEFQVFFADGNHENFEVLDPDAAAPVRMSRNLTYVPRGVALDIGGVRVGFLGGAESIDREYRTPGRDWWPQERMTVGQINRALEMGPVDVLVTHDTTESVYAGLSARMNRGEFRCGHAERRAIGAVIAATQPLWHVHGHHHQFAVAERWGRTRTLSLANDGRAGCGAVIGLDGRGVWPFDGRTCARLPAQAQQLLPIPPR